MSCHAYTCSCRHVMCNHVMCSHVTYHVPCCHPTLSFSTDAGNLHAHTLPIIVVNVREGRQLSWKEEPTVFCSTHLAPLNSHYIFRTTHFACTAHFALRILHGAFRHFSVRIRTAHFVLCISYGAFHNVHFAPRLVFAFAFAHR